MTSSASNLTAQWSFRDGRDYVLSLTTTEVPNTISFWISDKITGEEWTGCYDENCIEILTKRTGCFKSFSTFLSMIKSAILKKSESVVLELLNIQDLAAISIHRQGAISNESEIRGVPLNFTLYNNEATVVCNNTFENAKTTPQNTPTTDINSNNHGITSNNTRPSSSSASALNKRKYLIVSYIGEFDKVHYPLPLNYSNPPDLNVMQNNIMKLKAEVTSLKRAKKELENHLETIKLSGGIPQHSHENKNSKDAKIEVTSTGVNTSWEIDKNEQVLLGQTAAHETGSNGNNNDDLLDGEGGYCLFPKDLNDLSSISCQHCKYTIPHLRAKINDLEGALFNENGKHLLIMGKLESANQFLRQQLSASEKDQTELWNKIASLKKKVEIRENRDKMLRKEVTKDASRYGMRQSRHDLFYHAKNLSTENAKIEGRGKSPAKLSVIVSRKFGASVENPKRIPFLNHRSRSNSDSTASYSSAAGRKSIENFNRRNGVRASNENCRNRSQSSASYQRISWDIDQQKFIRHGSMSPVRFNPTVYVAEKKMKQNKVANLRLQKIDSRIRTGSVWSHKLSQTRSPSPCKKLTSLSNISCSPIAVLRHERERSLSRETFKVDSKSAGKRKITDPLNERIERGIGANRIRSVSSNRNTKIASPVARLGRTSPEKLNSKSKAKPEKDIMQPNKAISSNARNSRNALTLTSELKDHIIRSPPKTTDKQSPRDKRGVRRNMAVNTSFTCDKLEALMSKQDPGINDEKDIMVLQEKLTALYAYLEACKSKEKKERMTV